MFKIFSSKNNQLDLEELLSKFNQIMASTNELNILIEEIVLTLMAEMKISKAAFLLIRNHQYKDVAGIGYDKNILLEANILEDLLHKNESHFLISEISSQEHKELFKRIEIEMAIPLRVKDSEIGLLLTGPKINNSNYSENEIKLLKLLSPQLSIAVNNAQSYLEIKEFNETLKNKIEQTKRELEESQRLEIQKAKELVEVKNEFVFIATHDLKAPVTAIKGFVEMMKKKSDQLPEDLKANFEMIEESSQRLVQLADDLLEVARSESGTIKINILPTNANEIIDLAISQVRPYANTRKISINKNFSEEMKVLADPQKLQEILENLLSNAVKYNKEGGEINIKAEIRSVEKMLEIKISDSGVGIPAVDQEKIFTKFFRAHQTGTEGVTGTGLGLYVVKLLVEKMNGKIKYESKENIGTTFTFTLPLVG